MISSTFQPIKGRSANTMSPMDMSRVARRDRPYSGEVANSKCTGNFIIKINKLIRANLRVYDASNNGKGKKVVLRSHLGR